MCVEPKLFGQVFKKFMNNTGKATEAGEGEEIGLKCIVFAHWSLKFSGGALLLTDLQGNKKFLTDIEVACCNQRYELMYVEFVSMFCLFSWCYFN